MSHALVALGANLGDRQAALTRAVKLFAAHEGCRLLAHSAWHETAAVGGPAGQPSFLNGALLLQTTLAPQHLFSVLQRVEMELGRVRDVRWGPRAVDLDLLLYDEIISSDPTLIIPHPRMAFRRFVLDPAVEVAPTMLHPRIRWTVRQLRDHLHQATPYVAVCGLDREATARFAADLAGCLGAQLVTDRDLPAAPLHGTIAAGPVAATAIELVSHQRRLLSAMSRLDESSLVVSDFWIEQSRLAVAAGGAGSALAQAIDDACAAVVRPKLLLLLLLDSPGCAGANGDDAALLGLAQRPGVGPLLCLGGADRDECLAEAVAAVHAMG